jgi:hypothetical protein
LPLGSALIWSTTKQLQNIKNTKQQNNYKTIKISTQTEHRKCKYYKNTHTSLPLSLTIRKNEKAKFKVALRKYLNTHSFYSADEFFRRKDEV